MKLLINEFIKDYKKKTTWIYLILIVAIMAVVNFIKTYSLEAKDFDSAQKLVYESLIITVTLSYIFILIMFANNLSQEYSKGTIKFLYSKPKSRSSILTAKIFNAIFNFIWFSVITFVADVAMKKYIFYKNHINIHTVWYEKLAEDNFNRVLYEQIGITYISTFGLVLFYISLVLLICVLFKTQILSLVIVMFMVLAGSLISQLSLLIIDKFEYVKYLFTNLQGLPQYFSVSDSKKIMEEVFKLNSTSLLIMLLSYTVFFMTVAYIVNARRDITLD